MFDKDRVAINELLQRIESQPFSAEPDREDDVVSLLGLLVEVMVGRTPRHYRHDVHKDYCLACCAYVTEKEAEELYEFKRRQGRE